jgi:hypothetical protein
MMTEDDCPQCRTKLNGEDKCPRCGFCIGCCRI